MPNKVKPNVAVSYSWKEEREGANKGAVGQFCEQLEKAGATIVRDNVRVKHGESLSKFMQSIGASNFLCVFLSDAYLKSPNCMYELLIAWQRSKDNPDEFRKRVKVWVMPGSVSIHQVENRLEYTGHWKSEGERVLPLIQQYAVEAPGEVISYRCIREIAQNVNDMLVFFSDSLSPGSGEEFQKWIRGEIPIVQQTIDESTLATAYENTAKEVEDAINDHPAIAEFLQRTTTGLLHKNGASWSLSSQVRSNEFPVDKTLEAISKKISTFVGTKDEWRSLGDVAGGMVVLAIDREWVLRQRLAARTESAEYPADEDTIRLGKDRQASLLHLVSSALADGRARLEKVFGKPPLDEYLVPDAGEVLRGISSDDRNHAVKLHFIRYILGKDQPIDEGDKQKVDILFKRTKDIITSAYHDDHTPYIAAGPTFKTLAAMIRKELKIEDLLIIHPSGDDPEALLQDNVRVLKFLGNIFDVVSSKT